MKKFLAIPAVASVASFASETTSNGWLSTIGDATDSFDDVLTAVAPVALAVVIGVAGVRVAIKLINRGAGK